MHLSRRSVLAGAAGLLLGGARPARGGGVRVVGGPAFGAAWRLAVPEAHDANAAAAAVRTVVGSVDAAMSPFRPDSEISRFNASDSRDWQPLSAHTLAVVRESLAVAARAGGAFDPTVGPIVGRYGFGPIRRAAGGTYRDIAVGAGGIRKARAGLTLDLCGIAKGHAVDRIVAALDALGVADFLVEVGGEVFARGRHPGGRPWRVGIERPQAGPPEVQRIVRLAGMAAATSGDAANCYAFAGRRYSHVVDPRRGAPVAHDVASVSVLAPTATAADALATALMAMGPEAGAGFADRERLPALFLVRDGSTLREVMAGGFAAAVVA